MDEHDKPKLQIHADGKWLGFPVKTLELAIQLTTGWKAEDAARYGQAAYHAYGRSVGWQNYQGLPMPEWEKLTEAIRDAWIASATQIHGLTLAENLNAKLFGERMKADGE